MRRAAFVMFALVVACSENEQCEDALCELDSEEYALLAELANLGAPPEDRSNRWIGNPGAIALGHALFFDPGLSGPVTQVDALGHPVPYGANGALKGSMTRVSCASCHDLSHSGADTRSIPRHISVGAGWSPVNARSIVNAAYYDLPFWNGREDSMWAMIIPVIESPLAMNGSRMRTAWRIHDAYASQYALVFPDAPAPNFGGTRQAILARTSPDGTCAMPDGFCQAPCFDCGFGCYPRYPADGNGSSCLDPPLDEVVLEVTVNVAKAIAAYEHELTSRTSKFDRYMRGTIRLTTSEIRGARLFVGKAACNDCHNTPLFSDGKYRNMDVPISGAAVPTEADCTSEAKCQALGFFDGLGRLKTSKYRRTGDYSSDRTDTSRQKYYDLAENPPEDAKRAWRTPSLRDVALTAPYMHDGVFATLEEVVDFYNRGSSTIHPLGLDEREKSDLVAFLHTLTGEPLPDDLKNPPGDPPPLDDR